MIARLGTTLIVVLGLLTLFLWLAGELQRGETQGLDDAVLAALHAHQSPLWDRVATGFSFLGSEAMWMVAVTIVALSVQRAKWLIPVQLLVVGLGAGVLNDLLKAFYHRARPSHVDAMLWAQSFSFPSGHAMASAAVYSYVAYLGWRRWKGWRGAAWIALMAFMIVAISWSRLYLGVHYLSDVVAGCLVGLLWSLSVALAFRGEQDTTPPAPPAAPPRSRP